MKIINQYINRPGKHCGSTSIRDVCEYNGLLLSEELAFGLDGNLGFQVEEQSDGIIFVGGLKNICKGGIFENLGFPVARTQSVHFIADSWEKVKQNIDHDIPVIIQTDMFYLTYFSGINSNFPGHVCVIVGYDEDGYVYISERQGNVKREENGYCWIKLENLAKAIDLSKQEDHSWMVVDFHNEVEKINMKEAVRKAIYKVSKTYLEDSEWIGSRYDLLVQLLADSQKMQKEENISLEEKRKKLKRQYIETGCFINDAGTGGGLFRKMYAEFLNIVYQQYFHEEVILDTHNKMREVAENFYEVGEELKHAFRNYSADELLCTNILLEKLEMNLISCREKEKEAFEQLYSWLELS